MSLGILYVPSPGIEEHSCVKKQKDEDGNESHPVEIMPAFVRVNFRGGFH